MTSCFPLCTWEVDGEGTPRQVYLEDMANAIVKNSKINSDRMGRLATVVEPKQVYTWTTSSKPLSDPEYTVEGKANETKGLFQWTPPRYQPPAYNEKELPPFALYPEKKLGRTMPLLDDSKKWQTSDIGRVPQYTKNIDRLVSARRKEHAELRRKRSASMPTGHQQTKPLDSEYKERIQRFSWRSQIAGDPFHFKQSALPTRQSISIDLSRVVGEKPTEWYQNSTKFVDVNKTGVFFSQTIPKLKLSYSVDTEWESEDIVEKRRQMQKRLERPKPTERIIPLPFLY